MSDQATWFARLMAVDQEPDAHDEEADAADDTLATGCLLKRAQVDKVVRALATPNTRISGAAVQMLAAVGDYFLRRALAVRTKKITALQVSALPVSLRPREERKKSESGSKERRQ